MKSQNILITFVAVLMFATLTQSAQAQCLADFNHDHVVDGTDLTAILNTWGTNGGSAGGDINSDGIVNGLDLAFVLSGWGICPPTWATVLEWVPNPAVVTNDTMRNAITASGLPWRVRDTSSNIEMDFPTFSGHTIMKRNPKRVRLTGNLDAAAYADPSNYC